MLKYANWGPISWSRESSVKSDGLRSGEAPPSKSNGCPKIGFKAALPKKLITLT